jgi:hypothetical protein
LAVAVFLIDRMRDMASCIGGLDRLEKIFIFQAIPRNGYSTKRNIMNDPIVNAGLQAPGS